MPVDLCLGILKFEGIFDFDEHILLVTERLDGDMLNFILSNSNPKARLDEEMTRFLAFQLVAAIRYLHFKNIAYESRHCCFTHSLRHSFFSSTRHCDLKPDNVLINTFPHNIIHLKIGTSLSSS